MKQALLGWTVWALSCCVCAAGIDSQILVQSSPLAGFQYYAGKSVWKKMHAGDRLTLVREPDNIYDRKAIRVEWRGQPLGYVPRRDNIGLARLMDNGSIVEARIVRLTASRNPWQRVWFEVYETLH
ncbi:MAG: HIRAN domain-containing protein [Burkholderiales bacterium]